MKKRKDTDEKDIVMKKRDLSPLEKNNLTIANLFRILDMNNKIGEDYRFDIRTPILKLNGYLSNIYIPEIDNKKMLRTLNIQAIEINTEYRRKGEFKKLITEFEKWAADNHVYLAISNIHNKKLVTDLFKNGYTILCGSYDRKIIEPGVDFDVTTCSEALAFKKNEFEEKYPKIDSGSGRRRKSVQQRTRRTGNRSKSKRQKRSKSKRRKRSKSRRRKRSVKKK